jgi:hypothetical protein
MSLSHSENKRRALRDGTAMQATRGDVTAGFVMYRGDVYEAAPILRKYVMGRTASDACDALRRAGWRVEPLLPGSD